MRLGSVLGVLGSLLALPAIAQGVADLLHPSATIQSLSVTPQGMVSGTRTDGSIAQTLAPPNGVNVLAFQTAASPASGSTITVGPNVAILSITGTTPIAALTIKLPPNPQSYSIGGVLYGQLFRVSSQAPITLLTVEDASGAPIGGAFALTVLAAGNLYQFQSAAWNKIA